MTKRHWNERPIGCAIAVLIALTLVILSPAAAQEPASRAPQAGGAPQGLPPGEFGPGTPGGPIGPGLVGPPGGSRVHFKGKVDYVTKYYFRGFFQEDDGLIIQPAARVFLDVYRGEGWVDRVSLLAGMRNSLHEAKTRSTGSGPSIWYESDIVAGVNMTLFDRWEAEFTHVTITDPNGGFSPFGTIQEVDLSLSYDDEGLWGDTGFSVQPYVKSAIEYDGSAAGGEESIMLELGMKPGVKMLLGGKLPVRLSFPVTATLTPDEYYALPFPAPEDDDSTFGYLSTGMFATVPLVFIPPEYGRWGVTGGAEVHYLGDNMERFNGGDETEMIGRISVGVKF